MNLAPQHTLLAQDSPADYAVIADWLALITPAVNTLGKLAGTTEDEFLLIGSRMQDFYLRSSGITAMANRLAESVSGDQTRLLIERLRRMMSDMEAYLARARSRSAENFRALELILELLDQVSRPLEGFQKIYKVLRMLSTSTKIESSRLGESGSGFLTLALDVERLSHLVNEKSSGIMEQSRLLEGMIGGHLRAVRAGEAAQDREMSDVLAITSRSLDELISVNDSCGSFGSLISSVSGEVSGNIGSVVSSMQMHDMTRQQVEHIVEALDRLTTRLQDHETAVSDHAGYRKLIVEAGDVCELQSAQLRYASSELGGAVCVIVDNLRGVAGKLALMASETLSTTGVADSTGGSFMDAMSRGMATATSVLAKCAQSDRDMSATLAKVADTMQEVTGFVTDIEDIGSEIDLIALNAQVKAAHTGSEGAALGVLAEAIKRLSVDAVNQTDTVSRTLLQVKQSTARLFREATGEMERLGASVAAMEEDLGGIMAALGGMNDELMGLLTGLNSSVGALTDDIEQATGGIDVHERVARMTDEAMAALDRIVVMARELEPTSPEFKENLRHMEERYTMQSERHIHEAIARKRGGGAGIEAEPVLWDTATASGDSEFGDNVDLF